MKTDMLTDPLEELKEEMTKGPMWVKHLPDTLVEMSIDRAYSLALSKALEVVEKFDDCGEGPMKEATDAIRQLIEERK